MQSPIFERSSLEPVSFSLRLRSYAVPAMHAHAGASVFDLYEESTAGELRATPGFLRGFCWAIAIEVLAAFCLYEAWHLWLFLR